MTVAIVLHFRTPHETARAVDSIVRSTRPPAQVIVVENGETDPSLGVPADAVRVATGRNLGFAGGVNAGLAVARRAGAARALLVNSDATLEPDALERLESALDDTPQAGIAGPVVFASGGRPRIESMGIRYSPATGRMRLVGHGRAPASIRALTPRPVDAVTGCVMLIRAAVFDAAGLLDADFFYGFEDLDFCLRARRAGFRTIVVPAARASHDGARSIGAGSSHRLYYAARNHLRVASRLSAPGRSRLREAAIVGLNAAHALRAPARRVPARLAAVARGVRDYHRGRFGPA